MSPGRACSPRILPSSWVSSAHADSIATGDGVNAGARQMRWMYYSRHPMKALVVSDIHSNLEALTAVIDGHRSERRFRRDVGPRRPSRIRSRPGRMHRAVAPALRPLRGGQPRPRRLGNDGRRDVQRLRCSRGDVDDRAARRGTDTDVSARPPSANGDARLHGSPWQPTRPHLGIRRELGLGPRHVRGDQHAAMPRRPLPRTLRLPAGERRRLRSVSRRQARWRWETSRPSSTPAAWASPATATQGPATPYTTQTREPSPTTGSSTTSRRPSARCTSAAFLNTSPSA